jgi:hypothetical protein
MKAGYDIPANPGDRGRSPIGIAYNIVVVEK